MIQIAAAFAAMLWILAAQPGRTADLPPSPSASSGAEQTPSQDEASPIGTATAGCGVG